MNKKERQPRIPAAVLAVFGACVLIGLPILAHHLDRESDEFNGHRFAFGAATGWIVCAALFSVLVSRWLQRFVAASEGSAMAAAYDASPVLLIAAWAIFGLALLTGHVLLSATAATLCLCHIAIVVPRLVADHTPSWVKHAETFDLVVANVFIDNETPNEAAAQIATSGADVIIIVESSDAFMNYFDEAGGAEAYPHRLSDPLDNTDYSVTLVSRKELGPSSRMDKAGPLTLAIAELSFGETPILIVGINPMALVDPGGHQTWKQQIEALKEFVTELTTPVVVAGDFNTTRFRPQFAELLEIGLFDALDSLGASLRPSFKFSTDGVLGAIGAVTRLDHALVSKHIRAVSVENLEACGSDHLPFKLRLAVRPQKDVNGRQPLTSKRRGVEPDRLP